MTLLGYDKIFQLLEQQGEEKTVEIVLEEKERLLSFGNIGFARALLRHYTRALEDYKNKNKKTQESQTPKKKEKPVKKPRGKKPMTTYDKNKDKKKKKHGPIKLTGFGRWLETFFHQEKDYKAKAHAFRVNVLTYKEWIVSEPNDVRIDHIKLIVTILEIRFGVAKDDLRAELEDLGYTRHQEPRFPPNKMDNLREEISENKIKEVLKEQKKITPKPTATETLKQAKQSQKKKIPNSAFGNWFENQFPQTAKYDSTGKRSKIFPSPPMMYKWIKQDVNEISDNHMALILERLEISGKSKQELYDELVEYFSYSAPKAILELKYARGLRVDRLPRTQSNFETSTKQILQDAEEKSKQLKETTEVKGDFIHTDQPVNKNLEPETSKAPEVEKTLEVEETPEVEDTYITVTPVPVKDPCPDPEIIEKAPEVVEKATEVKSVLTSINPDVPASYSTDEYIIEKSIEVVEDMTVTSEEANMFSINAKSSEDNEENNTQKQAYAEYIEAALFELVADMLAVEEAENIAFSWRVARGEQVLLHLQMSDLNPSLDWLFIMIKPTIKELMTKVNDGDLLMGRIAFFFNRDGQREEFEVYTAYTIDESLSEEQKETKLALTLNTLEKDHTKRKLKQLEFKGDKLRNLLK